MGYIFAGRLHAVLDMSRSATKQKGERKLPGTHQRRSKTGLLK